MSLESIAELCAKTSLVMGASPDETDAPVRVEYLGDPKPFCAGRSLPIPVSLGTAPSTMAPRISPVDVAPSAPAAPAGAENRTFSFLQPLYDTKKVEKRTNPDGSTVEIMTQHLLPEPTTSTRTFERVINGTTIRTEVTKSCDGEQTSVSTTTIRTGPSVAVLPEIDEKTIQEIRVKIMFVIQGLVEQMDDFNPAAATILKYATHALICSTDPANYQLVIGCIHSFKSYMDNVSHLIHLPPPEMDSLFHAALAYDQIEMARIIAKSGLVDLSKKSPFAFRSLTPLDAELFRKQPRKAVVDLLVRYGPKVKTQTIYMLASHLCQPRFDLGAMLDVVRVFVDHGLNLNTIVYRGTHSFFDLVFGFKNSIIRDKNESLVPRLLDMVTKVDTSRMVPALKARVEKAMADRENESTVNGMTLEATLEGALEAKAGTGAGAIQPRPPTGPDSLTKRAKH